MRVLYNYMGSKSRCLDLLNQIINNSKSKNYCEPFLGSSIVFLNLEKNFNKYYLNDLQEENLLCYNKQLNEVFIKNIYYKSIDEYPLDKKSYYLFRDNVLNVCSNLDPAKAVYIFRIYNQCCNGMVRFNKNKFNSGYGSKNSKYLLDRKLNNYINSIKYINTKNIKISNVSFENLLNKKDCLYFFDPPYITNEMGVHNNFNKEKLKILCDFMLNTKEEFVYTDTLNDINKYLLDKFEYCTIDKLRAVSTKSKKYTENKEIVVWNFKQKDIFSGILI